MEGEEGQNGYEPVLQTHQLDNCRNTLEIIKSKIEAYEGAGHAIGRGAVKSTLRPLRWPFTSSEVQGLLSEIEIHKANLSLALAADEYSKLVELLSTQGKICEAMQGIQSKLDQSALTNRRRQIEDSFGSIHPGKSHDMSRKLRHTSSGLWLTNGKEFQEWLGDKTAKNIWCYGIPGSGKTVLASTVIEEVQQRRCESVATAYFYCDHNDVETQDPANILGSLAKQLVGQNDACFEKAAAFYEAHHSEKHVSTSYSPNELRELILQMSSIFDRTMIVVDGLDECEKNIMIVVKLLSSLGKSNISSVQTLFLSRDEIEIRETLADYTPLSIAASKHDLRLYVTLKLATRMQKLHNKNKPLVDLFTDRLVNGANGMFRWAACQIDYLCELPNDRERRRALDTLPPDLKSTYERILSRVDERNIPAQLLVQRTLRRLFVARELTISALREALSMKDGTQRLDRDDVPDEFDLLRACSSLVRKSTSGQELELAHFTVKEFLLGIDCESPFSPYRVDLEQSEVELAKACLTHLTLQDFDSRAS